MIIQIEPWIDESELTELKRVIDSTFVVEHNLTREFEDLTKSLTGASYAVAVTNGTMALYASLIALDIHPGDEVIVPNITFVATANAVIMAGAKPVLCEIKESSFMIDVNKAQRLVTKKTKAIIPVHLYGQAANMDEILNFAKKNSLKVLEDAAQGVGVKYKGKHVGTFGEIGILSYYGNKTITCGEGGMVLTNNKDLAEKVYKLKNHGRIAKGTFIHESIGYNFSFTEMQAAVGISQMKKLPQIIKKKKEIFDIYEKQLKGIEGFKIVSADKNVSPVFWFTSFLCNEAEGLADYLRKNGIQTRRFFYPLHLQPCYSDKRYIQNIDDDFSISEKVYRKGISLPSSYHLTEQQQGIVISQIKKFYENRN